MFFEVYCKIIKPFIYKCFEQESRLERAGKEDYFQDLFSGCGLVFVCEKTAPPRNDMIKLLTLCGANVSI